MDPKLKQQNLKNKITYVLALKYVHSERDLEPQNALQHDVVFLTNLVDELIDMSRSGEGCKEIIEHYDGIKKYWDKR